MKQLDMKNEMQQTRNIKDVYTEKEHYVLNLKTHRMQSSIAPTCETGKRPAIELNSTPNIFLAQNKGKGPPGRQRSPVVIKPNRFHKPVRFDKTNDIISDPHSLPSNFRLRSFHPNDFETITDKKQDDYKFYKFNFFQLLNSITMKKQILFLAMFTLALFFVSSSKVFGQVDYHPYLDAAPASCVTAKTLTCAGTTTTPELSPTPGVSYNYKIKTDPTTVGSILWFVTTNPEIIKVSGTAPVLQASREDKAGAGNYVLSATSAVYNTPGTVDNIDIVWKNFDGNANTVFVVAYVQGASNCSDNVEIWRIKPIFNFTLDVMSMYDNGTLGTTAAPANECVAPVESATYTPGTPGNLTMNYGKNYVFFEVNAANFVGSWMPNLSAAAVGGAAVASVAWAYPADATSGAAAGWHPTTDAVNAKVAGGVVNGTGECIIVRVEINNASTEAPVGASPSVVTLTVNGIMHDPTGAGSYTNNALRDVDEGSPTCVQDHDDTAIYNINARPNIDEVTPAAPTFIPKN
jgi:hypothetical protein